jgi:hypothetical protein
MFIDPKDLRKALSDFGGQAIELKKEFDTCVSIKFKHHVDALLRQELVLDLEHILEGKSVTLKVPYWTRGSLYKSWFGGNSKEGDAVALLSEIYTNKAEAEAQKAMEDLELKGEILSFAMDSYSVKRIDKQEKSAADYIREHDIEQSYKDFIV